MKKKLLFLIPMAAIALAGCSGTKDEHNLKFVEETAATCLQAGIKAHYHCDHCNKDFIDSEAKEEITDLVLPALGHDMKHVEMVAAGCTNTGTLEHWTCSHEEGIFYKDEEGTEKFANAQELVIPAGNHDYFLEISGTYKTEYEAFESFDKTGLEVTLECNSCDYSKTLNSSEFTIAYQTSGADSFRFGDTLVAVCVTTEGIFAQKNITGLEVSKKIIETPSAGTNYFVYDGTSKTFDIEENEYYEISDNVATDAGSYFAKATLKYPSDCAWKDNSEIVELPIPFTIGKASNVISNVADSYETFCGVDVDVTGVSSSSGTLNCTYYTEIDCLNQVSLDNLTEGDYFVKISAGNQNYEDAYVVKPLKVSHNLSHHEEKAPTFFEEGCVEYWGCEGCGLAFSDEEMKNPITDFGIPAKGVKISDSAICSNGVQYETVTDVEAPEGFEIVNKLSVSGDRSDTKYYSQILLKKYEQVAFAIKCSGYLLIDGWSSYVDDNSWVTVTITPTGEFTYDVDFVSDNGTYEYHPTFTYDELAGEGYVLGGLNNLMYKCCTYSNAPSDSFYVTELKASAKQKKLFGTMISDSAICSNGVSYEAVTDVDAPEEGFNIVNKLSVAGARSDSKYYSQVIVDNYEQVAFAIKVSGYLLLDGWGKFVANGSWVTITITPKGDYTYDVSFVPQSGSILDQYSNTYDSFEVTYTYAELAGEGYVLGGLNNLMFKCDVWSSSQSDSFYVTELRAIEK